MVKQLMAVTDLLELCLQNKPNFEEGPDKDNVVAKSAFVGRSLLESWFHLTFFF